MALGKVVLFLHPYSHTLNPSSINLPNGYWYRLLQIGH